MNDGIILFYIENEIRQCASQAERELTTKKYLEGITFSSTVDKRKRLL
jgi:hypothetical protein